MPTPELLAPAGDIARLEAALRYGANAVYLGGKAHSLRASAAGFAWDELPRALALAHGRGARVYYALNVLAHEAHLPGVEETLERLAALEESEGATVDALIIADPGVVALARRRAPRIPIHLSTQANTANSAAARFWRDVGVTRVNVARELGARGIRAMRKAVPDLELEIFVHGAMCMAVSGQCLMSAYLNQRSANLGACSHPCRYEYRPWDEDPELEMELEEAKREGAATWRVHGHADWTKVLAADDLCLVKYLPWFVKQGIAGLKIEGRTKSEGYVAQVVDVYRTALDDAVSGHFRPERYLWELRNIGTRRMATGFFLSCGKPMAWEPLPPAERRPVVAKILAEISPGTWRVATRFKWSASADLHLLEPGLSRPLLARGDYALETAEGEAVLQAHPGVELVLRTENPALEPGLFLRLA